MARYSLNYNSVVIFIQQITNAQPIGDKHNVKFVVT